MMCFVCCTVSEYRVNNVQFLSKNSGEAILVCTTGELIPFCSCQKYQARKQKVSVCLVESKVGIPLHCFVRKVCQQNKFSAN